MNCIKRVFLLLVVCFGVMMSYAQQAPFGVKGTVVDVESYQPLAGVTVTIANSQLGTTTNDKGEFFIPLPSDKSAEYLIRATLMGYDAQEMNFTLQSSDTEFVSFALKNADAVIEEVVVTRRREKFTELALLEERKKSNLMVESIGAQELSRKGVSDARAALTKMAGVSRQEGVKNVFVRGLGDRYNSSSLNGLPLPSEDPLNKNISLDFFSSDVIQSINVNKTFNSNIAGDVTGANVDIFTKEATGNSFEINVGGGVNSQTVGADNFRRIDGTNWFGSLPGGSKPKMTSFDTYNFGNSWNPNPQGSLFNSNFKLLGNKRVLIGNNPLSIFFTASMDSKYRYANGKIQQSDDQGRLILNQDFVRNEYTVSQTGMLNLRYTWGNSNVSFNSLYIHDQRQDLSDFHGFEENVGDAKTDVVDMRRQQVNDNHVFVNQLLSKLFLNEKWSADLGLAMNNVIGNEPDRRINRAVTKDATGTNLSRNSAGENERYFGDMDETGYIGKAILNYNLDNESGLERKISFGYTGNFVNRNFNWWEFNHQLRAVAAPPLDLNNIEAIIGAEGYRKYFDLVTNRGGDGDVSNLNPFYYKGSRRTQSGIASAIYQFTPEFTAVLGLRLDNVFQSVSYQTNLPDYSTSNYNKINKNYFLPSLNLKYSLTENMFLRASGSKTYTVPQFIELAPVRYRGNNNFTQGNPALNPSESINADFKWEFYPSNSELVSLGLFYKNIKNPIAKVESGSSGSTLSFYNIGKDAVVFGAELELKKDLIKSSGANGENVLSGGLNVSYLHSDQKLSLEGRSFNKESDQMEGASPLLVNADLTYKLAFANVDLTPSVVFNYFSDRIFSYGTSGYKNIMEKGIPSLDFVTQAMIKKRIGVNLKIENILNPNRELSREIGGDSPKVLIEQYKRGVDFNLGISYKF
ncbi:TonB-dependent receptor domain-containing protein [Sphingobacterium sp. NPDC055431]